MDQRVSPTEYCPVSMVFLSIRLFVYSKILVTNVISEGSSGTSSDLYMTYIFEWRHPEIKAGSAELEELHAKHKGVAKMAVDKSIESIRKFVKEGVIN